MNHEFVALIRELYQKVGGNPGDLLIEPSKDLFGNAYRVTKGAKEEILKRRDLEGRNFIPIQTQLASSLNHSRAEEEMRIFYTAIGGRMEKKPRYLYTDGISKGEENLTFLILDDKAPIGSLSQQDKSTLKPMCDTLDRALSHLREAGYESTRPRRRDNLFNGTAHCQP